MKIPQKTSNSHQFFIKMTLPLPVIWRNVMSLSRKLNLIRNTSMVKVAKKLLCWIFAQQIFLSAPLLCYVMWNLFTVGSIQFSNYSTIALLEANYNWLFLSGRLGEIIDTKIQVWYRSHQNEVSRRDKHVPKQFNKFLRLSQNKVDLAKFLIEGWSTNENHCRLLEGNELCYSGRQSI